MKFCIKEPLPSKSCFVSSPCCSVLPPPPQLSPGRIIIWVLGRLYHFFYLPYNILWWNIFSPNSINLSFRIMLVTNDWKTSGKNHSKITSNSLYWPIKWILGDLRRWKYIKSFLTTKKKSITSKCSLSPLINPKWSRGHCSKKCSTIWICSKKVRKVPKPK